MSIERVLNYIDAVDSLALGKYKMCSENGEVEWKDDATDLPSESEIQAELIRLQAEFTAQAYARNRASEYPSLLELTVALYDTDDKSAVEAKRASVKLKYPKPS
jgi:hypothetical protein